MKGITPVIATILLLLITISMVGLAMVFFQRTAQTAAEAGDEQLAQHLANSASQPRIESINRNMIYLRNAGSSDLENLAFFVNNAAVGHVGPATLAPSTTGTYYLNDAQLAMLEDGAVTIKVTSGGFADTLASQCFYCNDALVYWKFDEGSGSTATDSSGNGNDGTLSSGAAWAAGKYGNALDLNAANEYAEKDWADFAISDYSVEFWMKAGTVSSGWRDMVTIQSETGRFHLDASDNSIVWYSVDGTGSLDSNVVPVAGQWYHVVGVHQGSTAKIYVNGELRNTKTAAASTPSERLKVGTESEIFVGQIDEVRVLNVARTMTTS